MKEFIGFILAVMGALGLFFCGLGVTVSVIAWIASIVGVPFIVGAGTLIFKFAGLWVLSALSAMVGYSLLNN